MRLLPGSTPHLVLAAIAVHGRPLDRAETYRLALDVAGSKHLACVTLQRLRDRGFLACEYRVPDEGAAALQEASAR